MTLAVTAAKKERRLYEFDFQGKNKLPMLIEYYNAIDDSNIIIMLVNHERDCYQPYEADGIVLKSSSMLWPEQTFIKAINLQCLDFKPLKGKISLENV